MNDSAGEGLSELLILLSSSALHGHVSEGKGHASDEGSEKGNTWSIGFESSLLLLWESSGFLSDGSVIVDGVVRVSVIIGLVAVSIACFNNWSGPSININFGVLV